MILRDLVRKWRTSSPPMTSEELRGLLIQDWAKICEQSSRLMHDERVFEIPEQADDPFREVFSEVSAEAIINEMTSFDFETVPMSGPSALTREAEAQLFGSGPTPPAESAFDAINADWVGAFGGPLPQGEITVNPMIRTGRMPVREPSSVITWGRTRRLSSQEPPQQRIGRSAAEGYSTRERDPRINEDFFARYSDAVSSLMDYSAVETRVMAQILEAGRRVTPNEASTRSPQKSEEELEFEIVARTVTRKKKGSTLKEDPVYTWALNSSKPYGGKTVVYEVRLNQDGTTSCNCPGWIFARQGIHTCKHVKNEEVVAEAKEMFKLYKEGKELPTIAPTESQAAALRQGKKTDEEIQNFGRVLDL